MQKIRTWRKPQTAPGASGDPPSSYYPPSPGYPPASGYPHLSRSYSVTSAHNSFADITEERGGPSEVDLLTARAEQMSFSGQAPDPVRQPPGPSNDDELSMASEETAEGDSRSGENNDVVLSQATISKELYDVNTDLPLPLVPKQADEQFRETYHKGDRINKLRENVKVLRVGLTFLPGADKPQVMRLEQANMNPSTPPDQRTAEWRGKTAASLLKMHDITQQLELDVKYQPPKGIGWFAAQNGMPQQSPYFPDFEAPTSQPDRDFEYDTIDSDQVKIVHDLRAHEGRFDIESTLVEVDHDAMVSLIVRYRHIVMKNGPQATNASTKEVLDTMIEDARKLAQRSPILFRTSFRSVISRSKNIRFGVNTPQMFRTITTSRGIKEIVSWSAAYYKSLDDPQNMAEEQKAIKTKFLQMLVALLSLLNDEDLKGIRNYIESTFRLKADRQSIELLCLKVIPLMSINPKLFMMEMLRAFDGCGIYEPDEGDLSACWDAFLKHRIADGYILPGSLTTLGRECFSWIPKWPKDGFSSSVIFRDLQYAGSLQTINEIPQIDLRPQEDSSPLTVMLVNHDRYLIDPKDYERIVVLQSGRYTLKKTQSTESDEDSHSDMMIDEFWVNESTKRASSELNEIIKLVNKYLDSSRRGSRGSKLVRYGLKSASIHRFPEYRLRAGKITKHIARLGAHQLAASYKEKGYKVTKWDVAGNLNEDNHQMRLIVNQYRQHLSDTSLNLPMSEVNDMRIRLEKVERLIEVSEGIRKFIWEEAVICNDPIVKVLRREGNDAIMSPEWQEYSARLLPEWQFGRVEFDNSAYHSLEITARRSTIRTLCWISPDVAEVTLSDRSTKYFVAPLVQVDEIYLDDQIRVGDIAILMGYYLAVAEPVQERAHEDMLYMTNCLRITSAVEEKVASLRAQNRQQSVLRGANRGRTDTRVPSRFI